MATDNDGKKGAEAQVRGGPACAELKNQPIINSGGAQARPIDSWLLLGISLAAFVEEG